jgi:molybdopterin converting factor subunit 1
MRVAVKLFAGARDLVKQSEVSLELPPGSDVAELRTVLAERFPQLAALAERSMMAVNSEYAGDPTPISEGDEIALIPPVSGG